MDWLEFERQGWQITCCLQCWLAMNSIWQHYQRHLATRGLCACLPAPASGDRAPPPCSCTMRPSDSHAITGHMMFEGYPGTNSRQQAAANPLLPKELEELRKECSQLLLAEVHLRALGRGGRMAPVRLLPCALWRRLPVLLCINNAFYSSAWHQPFRVVRMA